MFRNNGSRICRVIAVYEELWLYTLSELIVDDLKMMAGRHAVCIHERQAVCIHEQQAVLSTTVVVSHTFCTKNEKELTPRDMWQ